MAGKTIGISMNQGWAGTQSRQADAIIQNRIAAETIKFGQAVALNSYGQWERADSGNVSAAGDVAGIAVREVIQANTFDPQSNPDYQQYDPCDVMVRGNCIVKCQRGTPTPGAAVYVRLAANASYPTAVVGGFEASSDSTNSIQVGNIEWTTGIVDANGMTEVTIKSRAKG